MKMSLTKRILLASAPLLLALSTTAPAQEFPLSSGDFWEISMIDVKDGGDFQYAQHLATKWKDSQEFAKSKGWIKDYKILYNYNPRAGEPDIYLISVMDRVPSGPDSNARDKQFEAWSKTNAKTLSEESGNRAQYRTLMGNMLLQQAIIK